MTRQPKDYTTQPQFATVSLQLAVCVAPPIWCSMAGMKTATLFKRAGKRRPDAVKAVAEALKITTQAVYRWKEDVPPLRVYQLQGLRPGWFGNRPKP
jgi:hypothetical protein